MASRRSRGSRVALRAFVALTLSPGSVLVALFLALACIRSSFSTGYSSASRRWELTWADMTRAQASTALAARADNT